MKFGKVSYSSLAGALFSNIFMKANLGPPPPEPKSLPKDVMRRIDSQFRRMDPLLVLTRQMTNWQNTKYMGEAAGKMKNERIEIAKKWVDAPHWKAAI